MPKDSSEGEEIQVNADAKPKKNPLAALGKSVGQKIGYLLPMMVARNQSHGSSRTYPSSDDSSQYSGKSAKITRAKSYKKLDDLGADQDGSKVRANDSEEDIGYRADPPQKMAARVNPMPLGFIKKRVPYREFSNADDEERNERIDKLTRQASSMPIDDQIEQALTIWSKTLLPINDAMRHDQNAVEMVEKSNDVLKRIFIATHVAGVSVLNGEEGATELPPASHYSHGNRVIYDFQADTEPEKAEMKDKLLNWISSGDAHIEQISQNRDHNLAFDQDRLVLHQRPLATHTMVETEFGLEERKGHVAAIKSRVKGDRHLGMPLTIGGYGEQDIHGGVVMPDGQHGYLYINDGKSPVSLMIGVENSAYGSLGVHAKVKHGVSGYTNPLSAAQLPKIKELVRHNSENHDGDYKVPSMGQARINIDQQMLDNIVSHSANDFQLMMLRGYQQSSPTGQRTKVDTNAIDTFPEKVKGNVAEGEALRVARSVVSLVDQPRDANTISKDQNIENNPHSANEKNSERSP